MNYTKIPLNDFLQKREEWIQNAKRLPFQSHWSVFSDPEDAIVCDLCNADVAEDPLYVLEDWLICPDCRKRLEHHGEVEKFG